MTNSDDRRPVYIDGFATNYDALVGPLAFLALVGGADQPSVKPRRVRLPSLARIAKIARSTGQRITVTDRPDGSRAVEISEQADELGEIDTPDELRRLI